MICHCIVLVTVIITNLFLVVFGKQLKMSSYKQKEIGFFFKLCEKLQKPQQ